MARTESAGGVVVNQEGKILVVSQRGTSWSLPKGHIEDGEDKVSAAVREIEEESGVTDLKYISPLGSYQRYKIGRYGGYDRTELKIIFMFLFRTNQEALKPLDPDNPEAKWVSRNEVAKILTAKEDKEFFRFALNKIGLP